MRWLFRYSILWIPAAAVVAVACGDNALCACSYAPTPQICDEPAVTAAAISFKGTATAANKTAAVVTYPPQPTVSYEVLPTSTPEAPTIAPSLPAGGTATPSATFVPPDPSVFRSPTLVPPTATPGPSGLPLRVTDIRLDGGACYVALIGDQCYWQEIRRTSGDAQGLIITMATSCSPHLEATFDVEGGVVTVSQIAPAP